MAPGRRVAKQPTNRNAYSNGTAPHPRHSEPNTHDLTASSRRRRIQRGPRPPHPGIHGDCTIFIVFQYPVVAERHSAKRGVNSAVFPLGEGPCRSHRSGATPNVRCLFSVALRVQPAIAGCARSSPAQACRLGLAMRMQAAIARCSRPSLASRPHDTLAAAAASGAKLLHSATAFCTVAVP